MLTTRFGFFSRTIVAYRLFFLAKRLAEPFLQRIRHLLTVLFSDMTVVVIVVFRTPHMKEKASISQLYFGKPVSFNLWHEPQIAINTNLINLPVLKCPLFGLMPQFIPSIQLEIPAIPDIPCTTKHVMF